jgi:cell division protein ZapB
MDKNGYETNVERELSRLESRLGELIEAHARLKEENHLLRKQQEGFASERAELIEKNEQAKARVEAMINRLKSMEQTT